MQATNELTIPLVQPHVLPGEIVLDKGPAHSIGLADQIWEDTERKFGPGFMGRRKLLHADWVATTKALYFVAFNAQQVYRWDWNVIKSITPKKGRFGRGKADIEFESWPTIDLHSSGLGIEALARIYETRSGLR
jgi:hypothetical protein